MLSPPARRSPPEQLDFSRLLDGDSGDDGGSMPSSNGATAPAPSGLDQVLRSMRRRMLDFAGRPRGTTAADRYLQVLLARRGGSLGRATVVAALAYSLLAVLAWSPLNPLSTSTIPLCGCFDPSQLTWSLGWTPYALLHHLNPFFSYYVDYPVGANMATNPLMPLLGIAGAPVTLLLGPVALINVLFRLAFATSALAMFVSLRRFVSSQPAAFVGGLLYGFSPFMVSQNAFHLSIAFVPFPPLILAALHDLLVAPGAGPLRNGVKLGLLCAAQYLIAQEVLADTALLAVLGTVLVVASRPVEAWRTASYKLRGLAAALAVFLPLCAYPAWYETNGPGHLAHVDPFGGLLAYSSDLMSPILPTVNEVLAPAALASRGTSLVGGNLVENGGYLGVTLIAVLVATVWVLRRDPLVRFCAVMACAAFTCSLGAQLVVDNHRTSIFLPMNLLGGLPVFSSELAARYVLFVDLFASILLAVALDRLSRISSPRRRAALPLWWCWRRLVALGHALGVAGARLGPTRLAHMARLGGAARRARLDRLATAPVAAFVSCALFALLPLVPRLPYHEVPTGVPTTFLASRLAAEIPPGTVVLTYPYNEPPGTMALLWAASDDYRFRLIGGYFAWPAPNDGGDPFPPPPLEPSTMRTLLDAAVSNTRSAAPPYDAATFANLRLYVRRWHVGAIVFQIGGGDPQLALRYLQRAFGPPRSADGFDVWLFPRRQGHVGR